MLDNRYGGRDEFDAAIPAVGPRVKLAVIIQIILAVELVFAAKLAREAVGTLAVKGLLMTLEMLIASECLVAPRIVALAHGSAHNVDGSAIVLSYGNLSCSPNLSSLQLRRLALNFMHHHLAVSTKASRRGWAVHVVAF